MCPFIVITPHAHVLRSCAPLLSSVLMHTREAHSTMSVCQVPQKSHSLFSQLVMHIPAAHSTIVCCRLLATATTVVAIFAALLFLSATPPTSGFPGRKDDATTPTAMDWVARKLCSASNLLAGLCGTRSTRPSQNCFMSATQFRSGCFAGLFPWLVSRNCRISFSPSIPAKHHLSLHLKFVSHPLFHHCNRPSATPAPPVSSLSSLCLHISPPIAA
jgi:hypothetical protein